MSRHKYIVLYHSERFDSRLIPKSVGGFRGIVVRATDYIPIKKDGDKDGDKKEVGISQPLRVYLLCRILLSALRMREAQPDVLFLLRQ